MPKMKKFGLVALAAVRGKKVTKATGSAMKNFRTSVQSYQGNSVDSYSSGSSYYSSSGSEEGDSESDSGSDYSDDSSSDESLKKKGGDKNSNNASSNGNGTAGTGGGGIKLAQLPTGDSDSSDSESFGCGTYHRRESLSDATSSSESESESESDSESDYSTSDKDDLSVSTAPSHSDSSNGSSIKKKEESPLSAARKKKNIPPKTNRNKVAEELSSQSSASSEDKEEETVSSKSSGRRGMLQHRLSFKKVVKKGKGPESEEEKSQSSGRRGVLQRRLSSKKVETKGRGSDSEEEEEKSPTKSPGTTLDEDRRAMQQRRPSVGGRGRGRGRGGRGRGDRGGRGRRGGGKKSKGTGPARKANSSEEKPDKKKTGNKKKKPSKAAATSSQKNQTESDKEEGTFSDLLQKTRRESSRRLSVDEHDHDESLEGGGSRGGGKDKNANNKAKAVAQKGRRGDPPSADVAAGGEKKEKAQLQHENSNSSITVQHLQQNGTGEEAGQDGERELTVSYKTELLANANSNLRSSVSSSGRGEEDDDDDSKKGTSRFSPYMAGLKPTNDALPNNSNKAKSREDEEHVFEAPKIVNSEGRRTSETALSHKEGDKEGEDRRSRFRVGTPSIKKLISRKRNDSKEQEPNKEDENGEYDYSFEPPSEVDVESISTESSGEEDDQGSANNLARMRYLSDDDGEDDMEEYYDEPEMTILTPITEMEELMTEMGSMDGSMDEELSVVSEEDDDENDGEETSASHGDDESSYISEETDDSEDDDKTPNSSSTDLAKEDESPINVMPHVSKEVEAVSHQSPESDDDAEIPPSDDEIKENASRLLLEMFDEISCVPESKESQAAFQATSSSARDSDTKTRGEVAFLLANSLALSGLDSEWLVDAACLGGGVDGTRPTTTTTLYKLGDREGIVPWKKKYVKPEERFTATEDEDSNKQNGVGDNNYRKSNRSLQNNSQTGGGRMFMANGYSSSLRKSLLILSQHNLTKERPPPQDQFQHWVSSFKKLDPRWQIRKFFNDTCVFRSVLSDLNRSDPPDPNSEEAAMFSVWRPTSDDAIAKMMNGEGVGKGLEIKGKSARTGELSGFVPFLQIHQEEHKKQIRTISKSDRTKIFFKSRDARDRVGEHLGKRAKEMTLRVAMSKFSLAKVKYGSDMSTILREELNYAATTLKHELEDPKVVLNDDLAPEMYSIEVPFRVIWEGLVEEEDISREPGSKFDTGRASQPAFQDMNFAALRRRNEPLPVLYQTSEEDPFEVRMLVMAYEEEGKVVPVVSDFDCFLIGSRQFSYEEPMSSEQVELLKWCVSQIEWILDNHTEPECWTTRWLEILKYAARNGFYPSMPRFGYGDPTSYSTIEACVERSTKTCGAVRHGPECFNFFFPQELDDRFLIIFPDQIWKYVNKEELLSILRSKIKEGFTFPLNPKWLLCDPGWITLFQDLLRSKRPNVQGSINAWFPPESGLRERILDVHSRFPHGFERDDQIRVNPSIAELEYERYLVLSRAKQKLRAVFYWKMLLSDIRKRNNASVDDNCLGAAESFQFLPAKKRDQVKAKYIEDETINNIRELEFLHKGGT